MDKKDGISGIFAKMVDKKANIGRIALIMVSFYRLAVDNFRGDKWQLRWAFKGRRDGRSF